MTYSELQQALSVFELPERVTLQMLRSRYRELVKKYHPDMGAAPDGEKTRIITESYQIICDYIAVYRYDFSRQAFLDTFPEERLREQFGDAGLC